MVVRLTGGRIKSNLPTDDVKGFEETRLLFRCEKCGKEVRMTPEESFRAGWDAAPYMYPFGVISPRTCSSCSIEDTLWWAIAVEGKNLSELSPMQTAALRRLLAEPESLLPEKNTQRAGGAL